MFGCCNAGMSGLLWSALFVYRLVDSKTCFCERIVSCAHKMPSHVDKVQTGVLETLTGSSESPVFTPLEVSATQVRLLSGLGSRFLGGEGDDRPGAH